MGFIRSASRPLAGLAFVIAAALDVGPARQDSGSQRPGPRESIQQQIDKLEDRDQSVVMAAVDALVKQPAAALPALVDALAKRKSCQMQCVASGVLRTIEPSHVLIDETLASMVRGQCRGASQQAFAFKQDAAFVLIDTPHGIELLVAMIGDKDLPTRRRIAFAFEELTERLETSSEFRRAPAEIVEPVSRALPKLAVFLSDRDEVLRCTTFEALEQARESKHPSVQTAASKALAQTAVHCR